MLEDQTPGSLSETGATAPPSAPEAPQGPQQAETASNQPSIPPTASSPSDTTTSPNPPTPASTGSSDPFARPPIGGDGRIGSPDLPLPKPKAPGAANTSDNKVVRPASLDQSDSPPSSSSAMDSNESKLVIGESDKEEESPLKLENPNPEHIPTSASGMIDVFSNGNDDSSSAEPTQNGAPSQPTFVQPDAAAPSTSTPPSDRKPLSFVQPGSE